jgi:nicotinate-nucleotide pyrophosphorylase (carboxylating)
VTPASPADNSWDTPETRELIRRALEEDIGAGDLTSQACVPDGGSGSGLFLAKQGLVVAGIELLPLVYAARSPAARVNLLLASGSQAAPGTLLATVAGPARLLLECERVALNLLCHLSGVATLTRRFVDAAAGVRIRDTRKTLPGLRRLEKLAVAAGGGVNHRMGLYDALLIKENHIAAAGGIRRAWEAALRAAHGLPVQMEVRNLDELRQALDAGVRSILLDNFPPAEVSRAVQTVGGRAELEVSGGVTLENVAAYAAARPAYISAGALTHSAPAADITFLLDD